MVGRTSKIQLLTNDNLTNIIINVIATDIHPQYSYRFHHRQGACMRRCVCVWGGVGVCGVCVGVCGCVCGCVGVGCVWV